MNALGIVFLVVGVAGFVGLVLTTGHHRPGPRAVVLPTVHADPNVLPPPVGVPVDMSGHYRGPAVGTAPVIVRGPQADMDRLVAKAEAQHPPGGVLFIPDEVAEPTPLERAFWEEYGPGLLPERQGYRPVGWLWRTPDRPWTFRTVTNGRTYPEDAEFVRVYVLDRETAL